MKTSKALGQLIAQAKERDSYWVEQAKLDFSMALERRRRAVGLSYAALAQKLGTSAAYISKVFRGDANLTIESMTKLARSSGGRLSIQIVDECADAKKWLGTVVAIDTVAANHPHAAPGTGTIATAGSLLADDGQRWAA